MGHRRQPWLARWASGLAAAHRDAGAGLAVAAVYALFPETGVEAFRTE